MKLKNKEQARPLELVVYIYNFMAVGRVVAAVACYLAHPPPPSLLCKSCIYVFKYKSVKLTEMWNISYWNT